MVNHDHLKKKKKKNHLDRDHYILGQFFKQKLVGDDLLQLLLFFITAYYNNHIHNIISQITPYILNFK